MQEELLGEILNIDDFRSATWSKSDMDRGIPRTAWYFFLSELHAHSRAAKIKLPAK